MAEEIVLASLREIRVDAKDAREETLSAANSLSEAFDAIVVRRYFFLGVSTESR